MKVELLKAACRLRKTFGDDEDELSELNFIRGDPPLWSYEKNLWSKYDPEKG